MAASKPIHAFHVRIVRDGEMPLPFVLAIQGATFFEARASLCARSIESTKPIHPDEVRPVPTGDGCRVAT